MSTAWNRLGISLEVDGSCLWLPINEAVSFNGCEFYFNGVTVRVTRCYAH
jgi:hypothetical protein